MLVTTKTTQDPEKPTSHASLEDDSADATQHGHDEAADELLPDTMDYLSPGQSAALLCLNRAESRQAVKSMLEDLGYVVDMPETTAHALQRLRFNQYHLILLNDDFEGQSPNPIMSYLAALNMSVRREMFVIQVGSRFKTADHLQAFLESVNLLLHPDDLPQLVTLLNRGLRDHERFYKVFTECLVEAGKKI
jgi:CheY-like chemotaxis protein